MPFAKELRTLRKGCGPGRGQCRTLKVRKPRPEEIRGSNAGQSLGQQSRRTHTPWSKEERIHRRDTRVELHGAALERRPPALGVGTNAHSGRTLLNVLHEEQQDRQFADVARDVEVRQSPLSARQDLRLLRRSSDDEGPELR